MYQKASMMPWEIYGFFQEDMAGSDILNDHFHLDRILGEPKQGHISFILDSG